MSNKFGCLILIVAIIAVLFSFGDIKNKSKKQTYFYKNKFRFYQLPNHYSNIDNNYTLLKHSIKKYNTHVEVEFTNYKNSVPVISNLPNKVNSRTFLYADKYQSPGKINILTIVPEVSEIYKNEELDLPIVYDTAFSGYVFQYGHNFNPQYVFKIVKGQLEYTRYFSDYDTIPNSYDVCIPLYEVNQSFNNVSGAFEYLNTSHSISKNWCRGKSLDQNSLKDISNQEDLPIIKNHTNTFIRCKYGCEKEITLRTDSVHTRTGFLCTGRNFHGTISSKMIFKCHTISPFIYSIYFAKSEQTTGGFVEQNNRFMELTSSSASSDNNMTAGIKFYYENLTSYYDTTICYGLINTKYFKLGNSISGAESMSRGNSKEYELSFR